MKTKLALAVCLSKYGDAIPRDNDLYKFGTTDSKMILLLIETTFHRGSVSLHSHFLRGYFSIDMFTDTLDDTLEHFIEIKPSKPLVGFAPTKHPKLHADHEKLCLDLKTQVI